MSYDCPEIVCEFAPRYLGPKTLWHWNVQGTWDSLVVVISIFQMWLSNLLIRKADMCFSHMFVKDYYHCTDGISRISVFSSYCNCHLLFSNVWTEQPAQYSFCAGWWSCKYVLCFCIKMLICYTLLEGEWITTGENVVTSLYCTTCLRHEWFW